MTETAGLSSKNLNKERTSTNIAYCSVRVDEPQASQPVHLDPRRPLHTPSLGLKLSSERDKGGLITLAVKFTCVSFLEMGS